MKRHFIGTAVVIVFCAVAALGQKPDWKDYEYPDDGFAITTPFKPKLEKQLVDTDGGKLEMHLYNVDAGPLWSLAIVVVDLTKFGDLPAQQLLQASKNGALTETKSKLVAEKVISLNGAPGLEYETENANDHSLAHSYYANGKTVTLMSVAKVGFPLFPDAERFFGSLRFMPAWKEYAFADDGFAISAPYAPVLKSKPVATPAGQVQMHLYSIDLTSGSGVMINVTNYGKDNKLSPAALQLTKDATVQSISAKLLSERDISLDSNPGIEFEMGTESYRARSRYYIVESKLVAIVSYAGGGRPLPPDTSRILDSLRLLSPQKQ